MPTLTNALLHKLVKPILPFADTDGFYPILASIRFRPEDGKLAALATDRYRIGRVRLPKIDADGFTATIPAKAMRRVLTILAARAAGPLEISLDASSATLERRESVVFEGPALWGDVRLAIPQTEGDYPNLDTLFRTAETKTASGPSPLFTGRYLADMAAVPDIIGGPQKHLTVKLAADGNAATPAMFLHQDTYRDDPEVEFTGLLQPVHPSRLHPREDI